MAKRANGEGTITKRKDGLWRGRVTVGNQRKDVYAKTQAECREKIELLKLKAGRKLDFKRASDSLAAYLQHWLDNVVKLNKAARTHEEYDLAVRLYIVPFIGHRKLANLNADDMESWQASMVRKGHSANQRLRGIRILRNALNRAVKNRIIDINPVQVLDIPKVERREVIPLELEHCRQLFAECKKHRLGEIVPLAVMTGLRLGELLALEWSDVNLSEGVLSVRRTLQELKSGKSVKPPKSKAGRRAVNLDPIAIQALRDRQKKAIDEGCPPDAIPIVFPNTEGRHVARTLLGSQTWYPIRKAAGIPETVRFHDLRHSHASLMIAAGIHLKVIQERLGHSTFQLTADTYSHLLQGAQADAANRVGELVGAVVGVETKIEAAE
ncbi:MAG: site-specific integrase [Planctomycetaceae bacterium]|nr:site-specific integrase [Planctomycetaceae bacterium]